MGETDKPFACTIEGCQMTFTNEDHLNVHRKKHDMVLNLGLTYKASVTADQTPTPTRFIRNCEEVGLFQDLQNVNPFEETFKKAIDSNTGILHVPESSNDDSLHTPQIFHHIPENDESKLQQSSVNDFNEPTGIDAELLRIDSQDSSRDECLSPVNNFIKESKFSYSTEISTSIEREYEQSSSTSNDTIVEDLSIVKRNLNSHLLKSNKRETKSNVKEKIKEVLHNKRKADIKPLDLKIKDNDLAVAVVKKPRPRIHLKSKLKDTEYSEGNPKVDKQQNINFYDKNLNEVEKRRAMNRMAQMRSRKRKKMWLDQMEQEIERLKGDNKLLTTENQKLKEENMLLKSMLLKHNDCQLPALKARNGESSAEILNDSKLIAVHKKPVSYNAFTIQSLQNNVQGSPIISNTKLTNGSQFGQKYLPKLLPKTDNQRYQLSNDRFSDVSLHNNTVLNLTSAKGPQTIVLQVKTTESEMQ